MASGLVARSAESAAVRDFLARALSEPAILVVEGEAGIGKSTILSDATQAASARGFRVLSASGAPAEVSYAYAAVADLLAFVDGPVLAELPEAQRGALEHVLLGGSDGPAGNERMVAAAFLAVIRSLSSDTPILLCIDDIQWLDASSRSVIGFVARRLAGCTGLIVAVRTGAADVVDTMWLSPARPDSLARLRISPLSLGGIHALVPACLGRTLPRPVITRIYEVSGGNPFFALELARFIAEDPARAAGGLPDTLTALVHDHIGDFDEEVGAVLLAAACAASPTVQRVGLAAGVTPARVVEVVESGQAGGVAEIDGDRVRFRHPLFASGVYSSAGPAPRRAIHRRLAGIVEEPELTARHLALAATTGDPDTLAALDAGIEATVARGAPAAAAELLELAIKLGDDTPLRRMRVAEQHFRSGAVAPARAHLQSTLDALPEPSGLRCMALIALAAVTGYDKSLSTAADLLTQAVDQAADIPVLQLRARLLLVPIVALTRNLKESVDLARITVAQAKQLGIPALHSEALTTQAIVRFMYGLGVDEVALELARDLEDPSSGAAVGYHASAAAPVIRSWTGDLDQAQKQIGAVQQLVLATGTEIDILWVADHATMNELWLGRYTEARAIADETVRRAEQMGAKMVLVFAWARQAAVAAHTGCVNDARSAANSAIDMARAVGDVMNAASATATLGFLEVSLGDFAAAATVLEPLLAAFDPDHDTEITIGGYLPDAIEALTALGRLDEAEPLIAALERNGVRHDRPWMLAVGARGRAHLLAARGELEAAEQAAGDALTHHERLPMPFELARTQLLLGQVQRRRRRKQLAAENLSAALETFERLGSPLWVRRARVELERMTAPASGAGLTAAERRVADLAAAGLTNKQIAAELFIAAKTVEMTLSNVYRKLGIRSRAGLYAALNPE
ncbi:AAA family ATPase [Mycobacterium sp. SVM_VP21]|nr:AAA family ATPase [Mycobacterium sp. SVM_VP21]